MIRFILNRTRRTVSDLVFYFAPIWHLTNLRREAFDYVEELHYQVGYCRSNKQQLIDRLQVILGQLEQPAIRPDESAILSTERNQLGARITEMEKLELVAEEAVHAYEDELPQLIGDLELAIQMTRLNRNHKKVVRLLGRTEVGDGSDVRDHIHRVRSQAYALSEQLSSRMAASRMRRRLAIAAK